MVRVFPSALVVLVLVQVAIVVRQTSGKNLVRKKREWILPPKPLKENKDYTKEISIAKIRSDFQQGKNVEYFLEGPGANQKPFNVFVVNHETGDVRVTKILDREEVDTYVLKGIARYTDGSEAEKPIDLRIKVEDENDNDPVFPLMPPVDVYELSPTGTFVTQVNATDADEINNINSQLAYSLISQNPQHDMFRVDKSGVVIVKDSNLDREKCAQYYLTVQAKDLNGEVGGRTATGTITINVLDVNDNPPTLEKQQYEGNIDENTQNVEVMRLKSNDLDLEGTENWEAVYEIVKGNEAGYFRIVTDPKTNEGILMLDKPVDYENVKELDLGIIVRNKAPPFDPSAVINGAGVNFGGGAGGSSGASGAGGAGGASGASVASGATGSAGATGPGGAIIPGGATGPGGPSSPGGAPGGSTGTSGGSGSIKYTSYPVKINVNNKPEGPGFDPQVKSIPISEGLDPTNLRKPIATYTAIDKDTGKPAKNVRYLKGPDPGNWLSIDPETAEITLTKMPDRESPYLINGTYFAKVLCISEDMPDKTATGTIAIMVEDTNDHCPTLTTNRKVICLPEDSFIVTAEDKDSFPNGPPFHFVIVPEKTRGDWKVEHLNDSAVIVRAQTELWSSIYKVELIVSDQQGLSCKDPQKMEIVACTCHNGAVCSALGSLGQSKNGVTLGPAAIGLMFLGLLLLLLIPLLLISCKCGSADKFKDIFTILPYETKEMLIKYSTEQNGETTEVPLLNTPTFLLADSAKGQFGAAPVELQQSFVAGNEHGTQGYREAGNMFSDGQWQRNQWGSGLFSASEVQQFGHDEEGKIALTNFYMRKYLNQTMPINSSDEVKDSLLVYNNEGEGSLAGSVGCCSNLEQDEDLEFLDDLGIKFKTLAEICGGKTLVSEDKAVSIPPPVASVSMSKLSESTFESNMVTTQRMTPPPSRPQTTIREKRTVVTDTTDHSKVLKADAAMESEVVTSVATGMAGQSQMLVLQQQQQQPVYYTAAPMLQPMHYIVQPQFQNAVILSEAPAAGLQDVVLLNSSDIGSNPGLIIHGQTMMHSGHAGGTGTMLLENDSNLVHMGNLSGSQAMMVVDGTVTGSANGVQGTLIQGGSLGPANGVQGTLFQGGSLGSANGVQGTLMQGGSLSSGQLSGTQRVVRVEEATNSRLRAGKAGRSSLQRVVTTKGSTQPSIFSTSLSTPTNTTQTVLIQETRQIR